MMTAMKKSKHVHILKTEVFPGLLNAIFPTSENRRSNNVDVIINGNS